MSVLVLDRGPQVARESDRFAVGPARNRTVTSRGLTLDELITSVWEGLAAHETVRCPACGGAMAPRYSAGAAPVGGACAECTARIV